MDRCQAVEAGMLSKPLNKIYEKTEVPLVTQTIKHSARNPKSMGICKITSGMCSPPNPNFRTLAIVQMNDIFPQSELWAYSTTRI
jgi:hypothetical protein